MKIDFEKAVVEVTDSLFKIDFHAASLRVGNE